METYVPALAPLIHFGRSPAGEEEVVVVVEVGEEVAAAFPYFGALVAGDENFVVAVGVVGLGSERVEGTGEARGEMVGTGEGEGEGEGEGDADGEGEAVE